MRQLFLFLFLFMGCGLTVTNEKPPYDELDQPEKDAVDIILGELAVFNNEVKNRIPPYNIDEIVDKDRISVSFEELIFSWNLGDNTVHVATWENLNDQQRELIKNWFNTSEEETKPTYQKLFYEFMAVVQGGKQFMYNALTSVWVFEHRTVFSIERDSIETALAHYAAIGRKEEMWGFTEAICNQFLAQYESTYGPTYSKPYFNDHFAEIAKPEQPTEYMYYICRWIDWGKTDLLRYQFDLTEMLNWIKNLT